MHLLWRTFVLEWHSMAATSDEEAGQGEMWSGSIDLLSERGFFHARKFTSGQAVLPHCLQAQDGLESGVWMAGNGL